MNSIQHFVKWKSYYRLNFKLHLCFFFIHYLHNLMLFSHLIKLCIIFFNLTLTGIQRDLKISLLLSQFDRWFLGRLPHGITSATDEPLETRWQGFGIYLLGRAQDQGILKAIQSGTAEWYSSKFLILFREVTQKTTIDSKLKF